MAKEAKKKYRRSGVAIFCYLISVLMLAYTCYTAGSTVHQINEYYAQYGMTATVTEYITYVAQAAMTPLINTIMFFMFGYLLDAIRKTDPRNYKTDSEVADAKDAKKEVRDAKKFDKTAARTGQAVNNEDPVAADFVNSLEKEMKADEQKNAASKKSDDARKTDVQKEEAKKEGAAAAKSQNRRSSQGKAQGNKASGSKSSQGKSGNGKGGSGSNNRNRKSGSGRPKKTEEQQKQQLEALLSDEKADRTDAAEKSAATEKSADQQ